MLILYVHLLCLASISQHETTILLSCGGFEPKSQKDRLTLIILIPTIPLLDVFLWVW